MAAVAKYGNIYVPRSDVPIILIGWSAIVTNTPGDVQQFQVNAGLIPDGTSSSDPDSVAAKFGYRAHAQSNGTPFWFTDGTALESSNRQRLIDEWADSGITAVAFCWYPSTAPTSGVTDARVAMRACFDAWIAEPNASRLKYAWILISGQCAHDVNVSGTKLPPLAPNPGGTWLNLDDYCSEWAADMAQSWYLHIDGRPYLGIYDSASPAWSATEVSTVRSNIQSAGRPNPMIYTYNSTASAAATLGADGSTAYGRGMGEPGSGHLAFTAQVTHDIGYWGRTSGGTREIVAVTPCGDGRARAHPSAPSFWVDAPTTRQMRDHMRKALDAARCGASPRLAVSVYADEVDEGDNLGATPQSVGIGLFGLGSRLDGIRAAKNGASLENYDEQYHAWTLHTDIARSGTWSLVENLQGAFNYSEAQSSTTNDTLTVASVENVTRIRVYGGGGTGYGTVGFDLDSGGESTVDLSALSDGYHQLLYDSGTISDTTHSLVCRVVSGLVGLCEIRVTIGTGNP